MKNKIFLILLCLPLLTGCALQPEQAARKRIENTCKCLMDCTEEEVVMELGAPQSVQTVGELKIYKFHKSYGSHKTTYISNAFSGVREEESWETFDKIEVFFKNGYAINWKCSVKR